MVIFRLVEKMESDEESCSEFEEPAQILYDIVPYKEWEQEPEVHIVRSDRHILIRVGNRPNYSK